MRLVLVLHALYHHCCLYLSAVSFYFFFFSSRRRHTRSVSAFLLNRSSDLSPTKSSNLSETAEVPACNVPSRSPLPALAIAPETKLGTASSGLGTLEP